jgi:co-chaperonin GroES (HSP10)
MKKGKKQLLVVGDRVLIRTEEGEERTKVGLYLPATAADSQAVQGGTVWVTTRSFSGRRPSRSRSRTSAISSCRKPPF